MKMIYIANIRLPTEKAYGVQIMNMCAAFAYARRSTPVVPRHQVSGTTGQARVPPQVDADVDVTLIIPKRNNPQFDGVDPFVYYGVERNFMIRHIGTIDPWWLIRLGRGLYIKVQAFFFIFFLCIQIVIPDLIRNLVIKRKKNNQRFLFSFLDFRWNLSRSCIRGGNDQREYGSNDDKVIVYTRDEYLLPFLQKYSTHVVWEAHTLPNHPKRYLASWQKCQKIVAISKGLKDALVQCGIHSEHIIVAPDGVDIIKFQIPNPEGEQVPYGAGPKSQIRHELGLPQDMKIILYSGHLYEWKGAQLLADAVRLLDDRFLAVFVGGTTHDVAQFTERNRNNTRVLVIGYKPPRDIPRYLNAADMLVLPNSAQRDDAKLFTSPMKLFEYMTANAPLIASRVPALQEILNDRNAVFFNPDDPVDLARVIQEVLEDPAHYDSRWQQANTDVLQYTWYVRAEKILHQLKI
ncbi:MAG: glycosyltransferase family 4 protein [Patescibacteria group bacterium]